MAKKSKKMGELKKEKNITGATSDYYVQSDKSPEKRKKISKETYENELFRLQLELVKLQAWIQHAGLKVVVAFEGRDAAGKGGG